MEAILEPIYRSPKFTHYVRELNDALEREKLARQKFRDSLKDGDRAEFINGEVIQIVSARFLHRAALVYMITLFNIFVRRKDAGEVHSEQALVEFARNDFMPDICYWPPEIVAAADRSSSIMPPPLFAVEILSESTADRDRGIKMIDYAGGGVREYWIVDAENGVVEQYEAVGEVFELRHRLSGDDVVSAIVFEGFAVPVQAFFEPSKNLAAIQALAAR